MRSTFVLGLVAAVLVAACSPNRERIYNASLTGGDYAILSCEELTTAILSIEQRMAGGGVVELSGPLSAQRDQLTEARLDRGCPGAAAPKPVSPAVVLSSPEPAGIVPDGRRLQVATFRQPGNRDAVAAQLRGEGFMVEVQPIQLAGVEHYRLIIGPLPDREAIRRADAVLRRLGLNDSFFVK